MTQLIIYQNDEGGVVLLTPAPECLNQYSIEAIALKDVPAGKPFKIIDGADLPSNRDFRNAWEVDPTILTDGVGSESNEFPLIDEVTE
jgi:hypothetical protein